MPNALRRLILGCVLLAASARDVAAQEAVTTHPAINRFCPVMTAAEAKPEFTITYEGRTVAFCCEKCLAKFKANPQRYAARLTGLTSDDQPSAAKASTEGNATHGHNQASENAESDHEGDGGIRTERAHEHMHEHEQATAHGLARLIAWLGKFHPPMVNFPVAMLIGAALAELLLILTRRPLFADAGRFCLWFGAVGAVAAAALGWFFGGFHLSDDSWILTTHRWLGTTTAVWAILVLIVAERSRRSPNQRSRIAYRAALGLGIALLTATGFFGGSLVYGLDHYAW
jgi:uncharacterized membrane protein/YHS domain-containing protein